MAWRPKRLSTPTRAQPMGPPPLSIQHAQANEPPQEPALRTDVFPTSNGRTINSYSSAPDPGEAIASPPQTPSTAPVGNARHSHRPSHAARIVRHTLLASSVALCSHCPLCATHTVHRTLLAPSVAHASHDVVLKHCLTVCLCVPCNSLVEFLPNKVHNLKQS